MVNENRPIINWQPKSNSAAQEIPEALPGKLWDRNRLYHGTNFKFNLGDVILPAESAGVVSNFDEEFLPGLRQHAFATWDVEHAQMWAGTAVKRNGGSPNVYLVSPRNQQKDASGVFLDLDLDPNTEAAVRAKSGFNIEGRLTQEAIEEQVNVDAARKIVTNSMHDLRIDESGQAFFLHASPNEIKVGEKINTTSAERLGKGMAGDALFGKSYGYDALNEGSIGNAYATHRSGFIYITQADASLVGPDLNVALADNGNFGGSNARAIRRRANYLR